MRRFLWIPWRWWRRASQLAVLIAFLWLFRRTEYTGADELPGGEHFLFHLDPLAGASAMLGARQFIHTFLPAIGILLATMLVGRFFCGWICPLGTLLDYFHRIVIRGPLSLWGRVGVRADRSSHPLPRDLTQKHFSPSPITNAEMATTKYVLFVAVMVSSLFAFPLVGFVDPFSLLVRGMTFWGDPMLFRGVHGLFNWVGDTGNAEKLQPMIQFIEKHFLPFSAMVYRLAGISAALLAIVFLLEFKHRRFWCRYLCPAGAMFGLFARRPLLKRTPKNACKNCGQCITDCRMEAVDIVDGFSSQECTLCMDCVDFCPNDLVTFQFQRAKNTKRKPSTIGLSRRELLTGIAAGAAIPGVSLAAALGQKQSTTPHLLRPPGAKDEKTFLNLCIRCGECMKVCPTNVLQPVFFDAGLQGMFSPHLVPRFIFQQSYCEYSCTLCGQVCPTGAIPRLTEEQKHAKPNGKAYFDHERCLPWAEGTPCIRCEEMCPAPEKAIKILNTFTFKDKNGADIEIQQPYVDRDLCVGCGICESNCTIDGVAGIRVQRIDAPDPGTEFLLKSKSSRAAPKRNA